MSMWELSKSANKAGEKAQKWTLYAMKAATDIIFSLPFAWTRRRKTLQESKSLNHIGDNFKKIIVAKRSYQTIAYRRNMAIGINGFSHAVYDPEESELDCLIKTLPGISETDVREGQRTHSGDSR